MSIYNISTEKEETKEYIVILSIVIPSVGYDKQDFSHPWENHQKMNHEKQIFILKNNYTCKVVSVSKRRGGHHKSLTILAMIPLVTSANI